MTQETSENPLLREALEWLVRLGDEHCNATDRAAFAHWLGQGPQHRAAWAEAEALWDSFDPVSTEIAALRQRDRRITRRNALGVLVGAGIAGAAGWHVTRPEFGADYKTTAGEMRDITLADGSRVNLGGRSALGVDLGEKSRRVHLLAGEAYFTVAGEAERPFVVEASGVQITALGTAFNVNIGTGGGQVAVAEHAVSVRVHRRGAIRLEQGWQAGFDAERLYPAAEVESDDIGAWRQGRLVFRATPLRDVLDQIARYRGGKISVWNKATAEIPVTAVFDAKAPEAALETITETLGLKRVDLPAGLSVLYS
jgi:Fe2+-dicitrate sensor, membrane component